jgi:hypothetical protein
MSDYVTELYARSVSQAVHDRFKQIIGDAGLVEVVSIAGYYSYLALVCDAFELKIARDVPRLYGDRGPAHHVGHERAAIGD